MNLESIVPNLMVEDVRQTINYYHGVLGFKTVSTFPEGADELISAVVKKGNVKLTFQSEDNLKEELPELRHDEPAGGFTIVFEMTGVNEYYDYLYTTADVVDQIKDSKYGKRQFTIRDVNGYYLTFAEML